MASKVKKAADPLMEITHLKLESIFPDESNPRKSFPESKMQELMESVLMKGVLQPIIVRPLNDGYQIVAGERRWRAAAAISKVSHKFKTIPAIIKDIADAEVKEIQIIENVQRAEMHPMEEAEAFIDLTKIGNSPEEICAKVGKSIYYIRQRMKLASLIQHWADVYKLDHISHKDALKLASLPTETQQELFEEEYNGEPLEFDDYIIERFEYTLDGTRFGLDDEFEGLPKCSGCRFNSAYNSLFPEDEKEPQCRNSSCFKKKSALAFKRQIESAKADPGTILISSENYPSKESVKSWEAEGLTVYKDNAIEFIEAPDPDDYGTDQEDPDVVEEEAARYREDLMEYEKKLKDPALIKAVLIDGHNKGKSFVGFIHNKDRTVTASNETTDIDPLQEIDEEVTRIKEREKRAKEIDEGKIWNDITELVKPAENQKLLFNLGSLSQDELNAAAFAIEKALPWHARNAVKEFNKQWGIGKSATDLSLNGLLRILVINTMVNANQNFYNSHLRKNTEESLAYPVIKAYFPNQVAEIEARHGEVASKRAEKVKQRLAALNKKKAKKAEKA